MHIMHNTQNWNTVVIDNVYWLVSILIASTLYWCLGHRELIDALAEDKRLSQSKAIISGLEDMKLLFKYCDLMGILDKVWVKVSMLIVNEYQD